MFFLDNLGMSKSIIYFNDWFRQTKTKIQLIF